MSAAPWLDIRAAKLYHIHSNKDDYRMMGKTAATIFDRMLKNRHWLYRPWIPFLKAIEGEAFLEAELARPVLDLACGDGVFTKCVFNERFEAGFDLGFDDLAKARSARTHVNLVQANAYETPFRSGNFGSIISVCAIEHMPDIDRVLSEVSRLLKPGGSFVFTVPSVHFGPGLLTPSIYRVLGLNGKAARYADRKNARSQHYHVLNASEWEAALGRAGLRMKHHRGVIDRRSLLLWSFLGSSIVKLLVYPFRWMKSEKADAFLSMVLKKTLGAVLERNSGVAEDGYGYLLIEGIKPA